MQACWPAHAVLRRPLGNFTYTALWVCGGPVSHAAAREPCPQESDNSEKNPGRALEKTPGKPTAKREKTKTDFAARRENSFSESLVYFLGKCKKHMGKLQNRAIRKKCFPFLLRTLFFFLQNGFVRRFGQTVLQSILLLGIVLAAEGHVRPGWGEQSAVLKVLKLFDGCVPPPSCSAPKLRYTRCGPRGLYSPRLK